MEGYNSYYYNVDSVYIPMSQSFSEDLKDTIEDLDNNIKLLKEAEQINLQDTKTLLTAIFEFLKDLMERFKTMFIQVEEIIDIKQSSKEGKSNIDGTTEIKDEDIKRLYL